MPTLARRCLLLAALLAVAPAAEGAPKNLLLVTVDTLRADALGCYGNPDHLTPTLDRLAEEGVRFTDMAAVIGKTGPSFATMFSSLYPPTHGARRNGVPMRDDVPVLAALLRAAGYDTAAFVSNWTLKGHLAGVDRGFDHYDENFDEIRNSFGAAERDAADISQAALTWLAARNSSAPLFLWVHYSDPHSPYKYRAGFAPPEPPKQDRSAGWEKRHNYASEVAYTDTWIGRFLDGAAASFPRRDTLLVMLADHGESLGEHGYWGHGKNTHWPNLRVPWILAGPGIPADRRVDTPVSTVDVLPTLLELLELDPPESIEGISMAGSWRSEASFAARLRFALGERSTALTKRSKNRYGHPLEISAETPEMKAIFDFSARKIVFYDLRSDAGEEHPLPRPPIDTRPPIGRRLSNWYRDLPKFEQRNGELSSRDIDQLRSLGYVDD